MIHNDFDIAYFTVKAENRQFEEAIEFLRCVKDLYYADNDEKRIRTLKKVQVAGTNGKGSTAAMLASILNCAGYKTGLYTSPSLVCVNERVRINGEMISDANLCKYIPAIKKAQEYIGRQFGGFERITAASMLYYLDENVDIAVMETGLGGRYDTVSAVDELILASITSIGMDHTVMLGNTVEQVAWEKCGIMRKDVPTVCHSQNENAMGVIRNCACENVSRLVLTNECTVKPLSADNCGQHMRIIAGGETYDVNISLVGDYQRENAANALLCAKELVNMGFNISKENIEVGFASTSWGGRLQTVAVNGIQSQIVVDGAHNPHAMKAVADYLTASGNNRKVTAVFSVMHDKDIDGILAQLIRFVDHAVCVSVTERSYPADVLARKVSAVGIDAVAASSVSEALKIADSVSNGQGLYALGSLYLVGKVLELTDKRF